jgi:hypothetical protein
MLSRSLRIILYACNVSLFVFILITISFVQRFLLIPLTNEIALHSMQGKRAAKVTGKSLPASSNHTPQSLPPHEFEQTFRALHKHWQVNNCH